MNRVVAKIKNTHKFNISSDHTLNSYKILTQEIYFSFKNKILN